MPMVSLNKAFLKCSLNAYFSCSIRSVYVIVLCCHYYFMWNLLVTEQSLSLSEILLHIAVSISSSIKSGAWLLIRWLRLTAGNHVVTETELHRKPSQKLKHRHRCKHGYLCMWCLRHTFRYLSFLR